MTIDPHTPPEALGATTAGQLETLFRRIAPADLGGHPVYITFASELPEPQRPPSYTWGLTGPILDLSLRRWLEAESRWRGRGLAIVLQDLAIRKEASELSAGDRSFSDELYRARLFATAAHELAHALSRPLDLVIPPKEIEREVCESAEAALTSFAKVTEAEADEPSDLPPWAGGHDAMFVRILVHVLDRAEKITGQRIPTSLAFPHRRYELSILEGYRRALAPEIVAFDRWLTFSDLRLCVPPKAFCELWRDDCRCWWQSTRDQDATLGFYVEALRPFMSVLKAD